MRHLFFLSLLLPLGAADVPSSRVRDLGNVLDAAQRKELEAKLEAINIPGAPRVELAIIKSMEGKDDLEPPGVRDERLLIIMVTTPPALEIRSGLSCSFWTTDEMRLWSFARPLMTQGDYAGAACGIVADVSDTLARRYRPEVPSWWDGPWAWVVGYLIPPVLLVLLLVSTHYPRLLGKRSWNVDKRLIIVPLLLWLLLALLAKTPLGSWLGSLIVDYFRY